MTARIPRPWEALDSPRSSDEVGHVLRSHEAAARFTKRLERTAFLERHYGRAYTERALAEWESSIRDWLASQERTDEELVWDLVLRTPRIAGTEAIARALGWRRTRVAAALKTLGGAISNVGTTSRPRLVVV